MDAQYEQSPGQSPSVKQPPPHVAPVEVSTVGSDWDGVKFPQEEPSQDALKGLRQGSAPDTYADPCPRGVLDPPTHPFPAAG